MPNAKERSSSDTDRSTIMSSGICVEATTKVMKNSSMRNGKMVRQGVAHGPAVATGTTVTSAKFSLALSA